MWNGFFAKSLLSEYAASWVKQAVSNLFLYKCFKLPVSLFKKEIKLLKKHFLQKWIFSCHKQNNLITTLVYSN